MRDIWLTDNWVAFYKPSILWKKKNYITSCTDSLGTRWRNWSRHCTTCRKVAGLILDGVFRNFHELNPSACTMALALTQPLTEMHTRHTFWGVKAASAKGWQNYHFHVPNVWKSGSLDIMEPSGPVEGLILTINLTIYCTILTIHYLLLIFLKMETV